MVLLMWVAHFGIISDVVITTFIATVVGRTSVSCFYTSTDTLKCRAHSMNPEEPEPVNLKQYVEMTPSVNNGSHPVRCWLAGELKGKGGWGGGIPLNRGA